MKTYYEKRSVEKDGMPEERNTYFVGWDEDGRIIILHACLFDGEKFEVDEPDEPQVGAQPDWYLVPVSERAAEERAIAMTEMELRMFANRLADYCKNNYNSEEYIQLFVSQFLTKTSK